MCPVGNWPAVIHCVPGFHQWHVLALQEAKIQRLFDFLEEPKQLSEKDLAAEVG